MLADATPDTPRAARAPRLKAIIFAGICVFAVAVGTVYVVRSRQGADSAQQRLDALPAASAANLAAVQQQPHVVTVDSKGFELGRVALRPLDRAAAPVYSKLECYRVYYSAGNGLCLGSNGILGGAFSFDANMNSVHRFDIDGIPSRVRVSPDGRYGAMTVFVSGHSYMEAGMSTRTAIVDISTGDYVIDDLEALDIYRDGEKIDAIDFNFWGVTFERGSDKFYATLQTGGERYLIHGDASERRADTLLKNVECPSLSPDGSRIAYKKRIDSGFLQEEWRLYVLDLATMTERPLSEERNVDDQVEWLDNHRLVYFLPDDTPPTTTRPDLWVLDVDSEEAPSLYWEGASSPAVVRAP